MTTHTPSAPTAEMLAQAVKRLAMEYAHCYAFVGDDTMPRKHRELEAAIDRLAALALRQQQDTATAVRGMNMLACQRDAALARSEPPVGEPVAISDEQIEAIAHDFYLHLGRHWRHGKSDLLAEARAPVAMPVGWKFNHVRQCDEDGVWEIGYLDEDDYFSPIITVDTGLYYQPQDAEPLARAILARLTAPPPIEAQAGVMLNGMTEAETTASASVAGLRGAAPAPVPPGWKLVLVNEGFDAIMDALSRASSKGYMPEVMEEEWDAFDWREYK